jgi:hypothetical protein
MYIKNLILFLFLLFSNNCSFAQSKDDTQLWLGVSVKKKLYNTLSGSFQYRVRKVDDISSYKGSYFYFALEKKLNKTIPNFLVKVLLGGIGLSETKFVRSLLSKTLKLLPS